MFSALGETLRAGEKGLLPTATSIQKLFGFLKIYGSGLYSAQNQDNFSINLLTQEQGILLKVDFVGHDSSGVDLSEGIRGQGFCFVSFSGKETS